MGNHTIHRENEGQRSSMRKPWVVFLVSVIITLPISIGIIIIRNIAATDHFLVFLTMMLYLALGMAMGAIAIIGVATYGTDFEFSSIDK